MTAPHRARRWAALLLAVYAASMAVVVLVPRPVEQGVVPLVRGVLAMMRRHGLPGWIDYDLVERGAHIALFAPFGILVIVALGRRSAWSGVLAALGAAILVEAAQSLHVADHPMSWLDVLLNVSGAVVGTAVGYWASPPCPARRADQSTPSDDR